VEENLVKTRTLYTRRERAQDAIVEAVFKLWRAIMRVAGRRR
jgi:hypothetical protein